MDLSKFREVTKDSFFAALAAARRDIMPSATKQGGFWHSVWRGKSPYGESARIWGVSVPTNRYDKETGANVVRYYLA